MRRSVNPLQMQTNITSGDSAVEAVKASTAA
jgi:hypothetical protein